AVSDFLHPGSMAFALRASLRSACRMHGLRSGLAAPTLAAPRFGLRCFSDVRFAPTHEWFKAEGNTATLGISDFAQGQLGEVVYVELPEVGAKFSTKDTICTLESVKAVGEVYAPVDME
ncbi:gcvH, partial [Symbiodinium sp. CCMP2456]